MGICYVSGQWPLGKIYLNTILCILMPPDEIPLYKRFSIFCIISISLTTKHTPLFVYQSSFGADSFGIKHLDQVDIWPLQWRHNEHDCVSNHQPHDCLLNRWFRLRSKKTSKLRVTGLCAGNSPVTGEFPTWKVSNAENVAIWWRHHALKYQTFARRWFQITHCHPTLSYLSLIITTGVGWNL